ncbi:hypothetical protein D3C87_1581950 [compost metagenome]
MGFRRCKFHPNWHPAVTRQASLFAQGHLPYRAFRCPAFPGYLPHHEDRFAPAVDYCPALAAVPAEVLTLTVATDGLPVVTVASSPTVG